MEHTTTEEKQIMQENQFTSNEIMEALMGLEEDKQKLLLKLPFETIEGFANNPEYYEGMLQYCDYASEYYRNSKNAIVEFCDKLNKFDKSKEHTINKMLENYKSLSREDRLKFSEGMREIADLTNSLDLMKSTWNKFKTSLKQV